MTDPHFLRKFLKDYKITREELAEECDFTRELIGRLVTKRTEFSPAEKRKINHGMKNLLLKKIFLYQEAEDTWSRWKV